MASKVEPKGYIVYKKNDQKTFEIIKNSKSEKYAWEIQDISLKIPGKFNIENACAAIKVAEIMGVNIEKAKESIKNFTGTWRRMEIKHTKIKNKIFIDDYGHHPTEINLTLNAIKEANPGKKILCIFQPHQYSRTKQNIESFSKAFTFADSVIITEIYESRDSEEDKKNISGEILKNEINKHEDKAIFISSFKEIAQYLKNENLKTDIVVTMGAGNINEIYELL
jgi:UDP-N-acetylmuramate--alanine ligase